MAIGKMTFHSEELNRNVDFRFLLPEGPSLYEEDKSYFDRAPRVLYLLHGHGCGNEEWLTGSSIKAFSYRYNMAVIMPGGENSFYLNHPEARANYGNFVGRELVEYTRKVFGFSDRREDTFIGGISMGGFGALHTGLEFPENFSKIMALSSALILYDVAGKDNRYDDGFGGYDYYTSIFGDLKNVLESEVNPETLALKLLGHGVDLPQIYMACGTEDFLLENNRKFKRFLDAHKINCIYHESEGNHNFKFWDPYVEDAIRWMAGRNGGFV